MRRWRRLIAGLALAALAAVGCKQQCFLTECDLNSVQLGMNKVLKDLECNPVSICQAETLPPTPRPQEVLDPDRPPRYISLAEAIAIALETGTVNQGGRQLNDTLVTASGGRVGDFGADSIRVLALNPAIVEGDIELALSKFDTRWNSSMTWQRTEQPVASAQQVIFSGGLNSINTEQGTFRSSMIKPLPTGGVAGITFSTDYQLTNLSANRVNPAYRPNLQFHFEQPLLQGFGTEIQQLRSTHPGSQDNQIGLGPLGGRTEGILITRIRFDQSRAEFERQVHLLVWGVEQAYWTLYGAYWDLYSREQALRQAFEAWKITEAKLKAGTANLGDLAQSRGQFESFRGDRIESLGRVLEAERTLRGYLGLPVSDGCRLVPSDTPTLAPYNPDWECARHEALTLRPEIVLAKQELKVRQLDLINQKNLLLPELRFLSNYEITSIGSTLDGPGSANAFRNLASNHFNNWEVGLNLQVPIGFREAHASVRIARLNLARSYNVLRDQELRAERFLAQQWRLLFQQHELIRARRAQREAFADQLRTRFEQYQAGKTTLDILLEAQRFWANALAAEFQAIVDYNNALVGFEFAKGTILSHDNVHIAEGPLPRCAAVRAVEHERERTKAIVVRERANPVLHTNDPLGLPQLPHSEAPALPGVLEQKPAVPRELPPVPEGLPNPRPIGPMLEPPAGP